MKEVIYSEKFAKELKKLRKSYKKIEKDVQEFITDLKNGETLSDRLKDFPGLKIIVTSKFI
jgi:mRNA-degrading endonuclease YafQ of YafQ-DinJ toxin-antitoxin module